MRNLLISIPWQGSENQILTLLAIVSIVGYLSFIGIAVKDSSSRPRKSFWTSTERSNWKNVEE